MKQELENKKDETKIFSNKDLKKLFVPLVIEQFLEYLTGLINSIMASHVGESAVSGISLIEFVMALLISVFAAIATGGAVISGQYLGNKKKDEARKASNQLIWFAGIFSILIMIIIYLIKPFILNTLFGEITDDVRNNANTYLIIVALSIPFIAIYNAGAAIYRTIGNSKLPMKIMLVMNAINVVGNIIFAYMFKMGIAGIALSTLITRMGAGIIIVLMLLNSKNELSLEKTFKYKFDLKMIKRILKIGAPFGLENGLFFLGRIIVLSLVSTFGTASIAANSVAGTIVMFEVLPGMAINLGLTVIISRCVGAGDFEQSKFYTKKVIGIMYIFNILTCLIISVLLPIILGIYGLSDEATILANNIVLLHAIFTITIWPLAYSLPVVFRAAGDAKFPMYISTLSMLIFRIALAYILCKVFGFGMIGTWFAMFIDWIVKSIIFVIRYIKGKWMTFKTI